MEDFKRDMYKRSRGGYSRLLDVSCVKCNTHLCYYQKDGPGILKRMYIDRISEPKFALNKQLVCQKCKQVIGVKYVYEKETRLAYRLFVGTVTKKITRL